MRDGQIFWHRPKELLRWETLQEDLNALLERVGVGPVVLPKTNLTAGKRAWRSYYDASSAHVAEERFGDLSESWGYPKSPL